MLCIADTGFIDAGRSLSKDGRTDANPIDREGISTLAPEFCSGRKQHYVPQDQTPWGSLLVTLRKYFFN
jgi:hypothetical protein